MTSPNRHFRLSPLILALPLLMAACTGASPSPSQPGPIDHPTDNTVIFRIEYQGGLMGPDFLFLNFPTFALLGDGRVIMQGAQIAIFPGPALPPILVRRLTEAGVQAILREVAETQQFGSSTRWHGADTALADGADAIFTLRAEGGEVVVSVYGLGQLAPDMLPPGMTAAEQAAHEALLTLTNRLMDPEAWLPGAAWATAQWEAYVPDAMRLLVRNADADEPDGSGIEPQLLPWPLAGGPADFGVEVFGGSRCGIVTGDESTSWYQALAGAKQNSRFTFGGHRYAVSVHFLLPDDLRECQAPA